MSTLDVAKPAGLELMEVIRDGATPPAALLLGLEINAVLEAP